MEQLRSLLKSYEERSAKLQVGVKPATQDEGSDAGPAVIVCAPCAMCWTGSRRAQNAGHEAAIEDETATTGAYPTVALIFTPRTPAALRSLPR